MGDSSLEPQLVVLGKEYDALSRWSLLFAAHYL